MARSFPVGLEGKASVCNAGDPGSIPGSERSPWSRKQQPSILSWEIPRTEMPGGLQFMWLQSDMTQHTHIWHEVMGPDAMILGFWMLNFKPAFSLSSFILIKKLMLVPLHFLPLEWYHLHIWGYWYFSQQWWFQLLIHPVCYFTWCTLHRS